jgi:hypothetical protein
MWKAQVLAVLRGAQLDGFLDGAIKAPAEKITIKTSMEGGDESSFCNMEGTGTASSLSHNLGVSRRSCSDRCPPLDA